MQENWCSIHFWSTNGMDYCPNAVSMLSQYFFLTLIQSDTQDRDGGHVGRILKLVSEYQVLCRCKDHSWCRDTKSRLEPKRTSQTLPNVFAAWNILSLRWYQVKSARSTLISRGDRLISRSGDRMWSGTHWTDLEFMKFCIGFPIVKILFCMVIWGGVH